MEHKCLHEHDLGEMAADINHMKVAIDEINKSLNNGVKTQTALNEQSIGRIWWFVGAITMSILGLAFYTIRCGLT